MAYNPSLGLRNAFYLDDADEAATNAALRESNWATTSAFGRGVNQGMLNTPGMLADAASVYLEPVVPDMNPKVSPQPVCHNALFPSHVLF
ncbi:hypothetical protein FACS1894154_04800 [Betaproteobacteria bacterium]|nr:hypothetical protein FACS1894154_04800 [Betaproteobacteria bacterium]GHU31941.1 hypothetical protein FACS189497_13180 [Betaproteobacteria bacterium]